MKIVVDKHMMYWPLVLCIFLAGCASPSVQATNTPTRAATSVSASTATPTPTETPTIVPPTSTSTSTPVPTSTPTSIATSTFTPTPTTIPTATPLPMSTPTPTPMPQVVVIDAQANLRAGPGTEYDLGGSVGQGAVLPLKGRTQDGTWWQVEYAGKLVWIFAGLGEANRTAQDIPVVSEIPATPTPPPTQTPQPTPTAALLQPGTWTFQDACVLYYPEPGDPLSVQWCVESIQVRDDGKLWVNVAWIVDISRSRFNYVEKYSDQGKTTMYLTDNLGNRYDFVDLGGAAKDPERVGFPGKTLRGWFLFPPAQPGAFSFTFHDDDQCMQERPCRIENLVIGKQQE